jgi:cysteine desulfurase family protein
MKNVYLDNAATSFPKPRCVIDAMVDFMSNIGSNPGRGGYGQSLKSGRIVYEARSLINNLFNGPGIDNTIFTQNITMSLNTVLKGMIKKDWHVITTSLEHNSVMRPLRKLEAERNISISTLQCGQDGTLSAGDIENLITDKTRAVIMTHASNLIGTILPVEEVGAICKKHGLYLIIDTAQTAGVIDIDFKRFNADVVAFTGHKSLLGPQGTGGFLISDRAAEITIPLLEGGTGSVSHLETQPDILPDKYESGTLNTVGIAGLKAAIEFINRTGIYNIREHEKKLTDMFIEGLSNSQRVTVYGPKDSSRQTSTISINIEGYDSSEISFILDSEYGIMTRSGMHCTPCAHKTIGTYPEGTVRFSIGYYNTEDDIEYALDTIRKIAKR